MTGPDSDTLHDRLPALLDEAHRTCRALTLALSEEHRALEARDAEAVTEVAVRKSDLVRQLESLEHERLDLIARAGHGVDKFSDCLDSIDPSGGLNQQWIGTLDLLEGCHHQNTLNGAIIEASRRFIERALGILRGEAATPELYDPKGRTTTGHALRDLARA